MHLELPLPRCCVGMGTQVKASGFILCSVAQHTDAFID